MNVESVRPLAGMQACEQPRVGTEAAADGLLLVPAGQEGPGMAEEAAWAWGPVLSTCGTFASCCHQHGPALLHRLRTPGPGGVAKTRTNSCIPHPEDTSPGPLWASKGPLPRSGLGEAEWDLTVGSEFPLNSFLHWRVSHPHLGRGELLVWTHNCWAASSWVAGGGPSRFKCWVMGRLGPRLTVSGCGR